MTNKWTLTQTTKEKTLKVGNTKFEYENDGKEQKLYMYHKGEERFRDRKYQFAIFHKGKIQLTEEAMQTLGLMLDHIMQTEDTKRQGKIQNILKLLKP